MKSSTVPASKKKAGFTLIEVLVISGLAVIIMLSTVSLFMTFLISQARVTQKQQLKNAGNSAIQQMTQILREVKSISPCSPVTSNTIVFTNLDNKAGSYQLGTFSNGNQGIYYTLDGITHPVTSEDMDIISFSSNCYAGQQSQLVKITFVLQNPKIQGPSGDPLNQQFSTDIQLRN